MTAAKTTECAIWDSVTEQGIFLQNDLKYIVDVVLPPPRTQHSDHSYKFETSTSTSAELSERLLTACAVQYRPYHKFFNYRQRALTGYWLFKKHCSKLSRSQRSTTCSEDRLAQKLLTEKSKEQGTNVSFSSHVGLLLLLPLLQSQSRIDRTLAGNCTDILFVCLQECSPNSLRNEPQSCIDGLAELLCSWLGQGKTAPGSDAQGGSSDIIIKQDSVVAALIALACGRSVAKTIKA